MTEDEEVRSVWLRSHVERCLEDIWERFPLETDGDGDWPYRFGTAGCWVHVEPDGVGTVRVVAIAARELKRSAKLLAEVNDVNARTLTAHAYFTGDTVLVEQALLASTVDRAALAQACAAVGSVANDIGSMLAAVFDGETVFPEEFETADGEVA